MDGHVKTGLEHPARLVAPQMFFSFPDEILTDCKTCENSAATDRSIPVLDRCHNHRSCDCSRSCCHLCVCTDRFDHLGCWLQQLCNSISHNRNSDPASRAHDGPPSRWFLKRWALGSENGALCQVVERTGSRALTKALINYC